MHYIGSAAIRVLVERVSDDVCTRSQQKFHVTRILQEVKSNQNNHSISILAPSYRHQNSNETLKQRSKKNMVLNKIKLLIKANLPDVIIT